MTGKNRPCWERRTLEVGLLNLGGFVTPTGYLTAVREVLVVHLGFLEVLKALEALEAFLGEDLVFIMMAEC